MAGVDALDQLVAGRVVAVVHPDLMTVTWERDTHRIEHTFDCHGSSDALPEKSEYPPGV